ncbi:hypothetical protein V1281_004294 [Nitrobacteraceae bacterium AZCC 2161]
MLEPRNRPDLDARRSNRTERHHAEEAGGHAGPGRRPGPATPAAGQLAEDRAAGANPGDRSTQSLDQFANESLKRKDSPTPNESLKMNS